MNLIWLIDRINFRFQVHRHRAHQNRASKRKKALLSYVFPPLWAPSHYYAGSHANKITAQQMIFGLNDLGYDVESRFFQNTDFTVDPETEIFIGHGSEFAHIAKQCPPGCKKVLFLPGSAPEYANRQQKVRAENLFKRTGQVIPLFRDTVIPSYEENFNLADHFLIMGTDHVLSTYPESVRARATLINNLSPFEPQPLAQTAQSAKFIFMSSIGQVHRGLDVLLEAFSKRSEELFVCSLYEKETEFCNVYQNQLFHSKNIHPEGFVNTSGGRFKELAQECKFVILPSCSEGQSSSVLNLLMFGLIPVATINTGVPYLEEMGFVIPEDPSDQDISDVLDRIQNASESEIESKQIAVYKHRNLFTPEVFRSQFGKIISSLSFSNARLAGED